MIAEIGVFFLIVAFMAALLQAACLFPAVRAQAGACMMPALWLQALCITLAFAILMLLRLNSDFSVASVIAHSNLSLPLLYKITGTWGNHEGSMLLWVWVLAMFALALSTRKTTVLTLPALSLQALMGAGFLLFILLTSNPFARQFPPTVDGEALNPLLQDIALAIHPPLLYLGYVGFSIVYALAVAALMQGKADREWARIVHPWILAAWSLLTLGIGLGSWWAYRELGWGGWWFWDPVENASLMPWLAGTALLHSNVALKKRGVLASWVVLLSILTFGLSLLGTFLVRSGALTSVHGFASDPARGLFILGYMTAVVGGALLLFAMRAGKITAREDMLPISREGLIVLNNLFIMCACATVLLGTIYPLAMEWIEGDKLTVGPPYFNATFLPLMVAPLLIAGFTPLFAWKHAALNKLFERALPALLATMAAALIVLAAFKTHLALGALGFGLAAWLAASSAKWLKARGNLPVFIAHIGVAMMVLGITASSLWKEEQTRALADGESMGVAGYEVAYRKLPDERAANHRATRAEFIVRKNGREIAVLYPEYRIYDIRNSATSEADIHAAWNGDLYAVIGEVSADGRYVAARLYFVPMIRFIWLGFVLMALGGLAAIVQPRMRNYEPTAL